MKLKKKKLVKISPQKCETIIYTIQKSDVSITKNKTIIAIKI